VRDFNVTLRKIAHRTGTVLVNEKYRAMNDTANTILLNLKIKNENFKI
jgi:hypothetical protein